MKKKVPTTVQTWLRKHGGLLAVLFTGLVFFLPYERIITLELPIFPGGYTLRLSHLFAILLVAAFSISFFRGERKIRWCSWDYMLALFVFFYLLSALQAGDLKRALVVWLFTLFVSLTASVISQVVRKDWLKYVEPALAVTTWVVLVFGFYQYFGDSVGLSTSLTGLRDLYTRSALGFPRIQSFGLEPLYYASFLQIPLFYYIVQFIFGEKRRPWLILAIVTQIILAVSRGAILAILFGLLLFSIVLVWRYRQVNLGDAAKLIGILLAGLALSFALISISSKLTEFTENPGSSASKQAESRAQSTFRQTTNLDEQDDRARNRILAIAAWKEKPLLGIGPGNFSNYAVKAFPTYAGSSGYIIVNNEPLEILAESGIFGFLSFVTFVFTLFFLGIKKLFDSIKFDQPTTWIILSCLLYLSALAVQYQTFSTLYIMHIWVVIGVLMGALRHTSESTR